MMVRGLPAFSVGVGDSYQLSTYTNHSMPPAPASPSRQASNTLLPECTRLPSRTWIRFPIMCLASSQEAVFVTTLYIMRPAGSQALVFDQVMLLQH